VHLKDASYGDANETVIVIEMTGAPPNTCAGVFCTMLLESHDTCSLASQMTCVTRKRPPAVRYGRGTTTLI